MSLITLKEMLGVARQHRFAVGAFNAIDSHFIDGIFTAAEQNESPIILNVAEVHTRRIDLVDIATYVKHKANQAAIPVALNLDHGLTFETVEKALKAGFTSIMYDGSHLEYEENVKNTRTVVEMCKEYGASVEGELGAVGGDEGGALNGEADESLYTPVDLVQDYIGRTGIDALAVAIGNAHGKYKGIPKLDFARLEALNHLSSVPLVLHGGSGLSERDFKRAIEFGIAKINFYTGMSQASIASIRDNIDNPEFITQYDHYLLMMKEVQAEIADTVTGQMNIFSSVNKKALYE
ncbi:ketose 1,6-bisphosphate aldolase [Vibrio sp. 99-8-1]|uniref:ketose 1,6-bisphosphate aldolase n=1 Tax=Vibrio sp. 99-8-1 TaxID=2607602 RepID=UPI0014938AA0|nr:ketose 1,6-bisphosphate aldolase [Vibrio sp. 99-8-1]NOI65714.1 ketose 1,6-bisphosphate aldolase [Vibrio sp. 99-8-1]